MKTFFTFCITCFLALTSLAQKGEIKGFVYDQKTGEAIAYSTIVVVNEPLGALTDEYGFFTVGDVKAGTYT
ncbi:MAG: hypothetical protein ACI8SE_001384, partial [Bacteroidia bacterium]